MNHNCKNNCPLQVVSPTCCESVKVITEDEGGQANDFEVLFRSFACKLKFMSLMLEWDGNLLLTCGNKLEAVMEPGRSNPVSPTDPCWPYLSGKKPGAASAGKSDAGSSESEW